MNGKIWLTVGIVLIIGIAAVAFLAAPIQAYINKTGGDDMIRTQKQTRAGDGDHIQTQNRDRLRTQTRDCSEDCIQERQRCRERFQERLTNRTCNCTVNLEQ